MNNNFQSLQKRRAVYGWMIAAGVFAIVLAFLTSCVTAGDLQRVSGYVADLEATLDDQTKTNDDVAAKIRETSSAIESVADDVLARTERSFTDISGAGGGGLVGIGAAVLMNMYRNKRRRDRMEPVSDVEARSASAAPPSSAGRP